MQNIRNYGEAKNLIEIEDNNLYHGSDPLVLAQSS